MANKFTYKFHILVVVVLVFVPIFFASTAQASDLEQVDPGYLPNSFWYSFEIAKERVIILFTFSKLSKAEKLMNMSTERISEAEKLIEENDLAGAKKALSRYILKIEEIEKNIEECNKDQKETKEFIDKLIKKTQKQKEKFEKLKKQTPELENEINQAIDKIAEIREINC